MANHGKEFNQSNASSLTKANKWKVANKLTMILWQHMNINLCVFFRYLLQNHIGLGKQNKHKWYTFQSSSQSLKRLALWGPWRLWKNSCNIVTKTLLNGRNLHPYLAFEAFNFTRIPRPTFNPKSAGFFGLQIYWQT